jgi:hypothetical protein
LICLPKTEQYASEKLAPVEGATGYRHTEPTIDEPDEMWWYYVSLRVDLLQVWIFDRATGEVYGRFLPTGTQLDAPIPLIQ